MTQKQLELDLNDEYEHVRSKMKMHEPLGNYESWRIYKHINGMYSVQIRTFVTNETEYEHICYISSDVAMRLKSEGYHLW